MDAAELYGGLADIDLDSNYLIADPVPSTNYLIAEPVSGEDEDEEVIGFG